MKTEMVDIKSITPYVNNPRNNEASIGFVAASLKEFGWKQPIVIDSMGTIVVGHTRYQAALQLKMKEVPVLIASDLTPSQVKAYRIADNKTSEMSDWNYKLLSLELNDIIENIDDKFDIDSLGFEKNELDSIIKEINAGNYIGEENDENGGIGEDDNEYTKKIEAPIYKPSETVPSLEKLFDTSKTVELINEIDQTSIPNDIKEFLKFAAQRHTIFRYDRVADYYSSASKEIQILMEKSALVIIDFEDAIQYGFTRLGKDVIKQYSLEHLSDDNNSDYNDEE